MPPVIIIGGGLAGAAAAIRLAGAGRDVTLFEREPGPHHKVCGEFLSYEAVDMLRRLAVDPVALGAARIGKVGVWAGRSPNVADLPFRALGLSRRVLDQALLDRAKAAGAEVRQGAKVVSLSRGEDGLWLAATENGEIVEAKDVFVATGKHELRGASRRRGLQADLIGFKLHLDLPPGEQAALRDRVAIHLFLGGYAGLQLVEADQANLCLVVRKSTFRACGRTWAGLVRFLAEQCPGLTATLQAAGAVSGRPLAIGAIPYGHVQSAAPAGLWRLGDQAAVIPSFAGEGMAIALHSGALAAEHLLAGEDSCAYQRTLSRLVGARVQGATLLSLAMVGRLGRPLAGCALAFAPGLTRQIARHTRLPATRSALSDKLGRSLNRQPKDRWSASF